MSRNLGTRPRARARLLAWTLVLPAVVAIGHVTASARPAEPTVAEAAGAGTVARPTGPATATRGATRIPPATAPAPAPAPPAPAGAPVPAGTGGGGRFTTLPPGAALPSDEACAAAVRPTPEIRPANAVPNARRGIGPTAGQPRVTGNFAGTTDEIIQWVACKWGIDEDVVRAQVAKESWWNQSAGGDRTGDASACHPALRGTLPCPESVGLGQVRYRYHTDAFAADNALRSSAHNLDYTYAAWRLCFEGGVTWLNAVERGSTYVAGDMWGCLGVWFSGRWHTPAADGYIAAVKELLARRVWETPDFRNG